MANVEIACINLSGGSTHEHITHLGYPGSWKWTKTEVINSIEAGTNSFYVYDRFSNTQVPVRVISPSGRPKYLRTVANGKETDNLLSLPKCP